MPAAMGLLAHGLDQPFARRRCRGSLDHLGAGRSDGHPLRDRQGDEAASHAEYRREDQQRRVLEDDPLRGEEALEQARRDPEDDQDREVRSQEEKNALHEPPTGTLRRTPHRIGCNLPDAAEAARVPRKLRAGFIDASPTRPQSTGVGSERPAVARLSIRRSSRRSGFARSRRPDDARTQIALETRNAVGERREALGGGFPGQSRLEFGDVLAGGVDGPFQGDHLTAVSRGESALESAQLLRRRGALDTRPPRFQGELVEGHPQRSDLGPDSGRVVRRVDVAGVAASQGRQREDDGDHRGVGNGHAVKDLAQEASFFGRDVEIVGIAHRSLRSAIRAHL